MQNALKPSGEKGTGFLSGKFREARTRLTLVYVCILALILLLSSESIYSLFSNRLTHRFARVHPRVAILLPDDEFVPDPADVRTDLINSLLIVNGILLLTAGMASYWLAGLTLEPIQEAYERQRRFLSDASHELRTPLAILQTDLENERLRYSAETPERHQVESHLEEVARMSQLVSHLLLLSRLDERANIRRTDTRLRLNDLLKESVHRLESIAKRQQVSLQCDIRNEPVEIFADKELLLQAMSNVLKNAIIYNKTGGNVITSLQADREYAVIRVSDTGPGIAQNDLANIFERFYRADESRSRATGGSGLGLAIVQSIMKQLNGTVEIESSVGSGTTVTLRFPIAS